jgi:hypothetical protein
MTDIFYISFTKLPDDQKRAFLSKWKRILIIQQKRTPYSLGQIYNKKAAALGKRPRRQYQVIVVEFQ